MRVVHDGDHGIDDAVALLFLLLRSDVEVVAVRDKPLLEGGSVVARWADYHCVVVP